MLLIRCLGIAVVAAAIPLGCSDDRSCERRTVTAEPLALPVAKVTEENNNLETLGGLYLEATAFESDGEPIEGMQIAFTFGDGSARVASAVTNADGVARIPVTLLNSSAIFELNTEGSYTAHIAQELCGDVRSDPVPIAHAGS
jgi:hypothetical protein